MRKPSISTEGLPITMLGEMEDSRQVDSDCPRCDAINDPQAKFCLQCGAPLREPCLQCGELCPVGVNYCGVCGANLADAVAEQLEGMDADFRSATEMLRACRYQEAMELLKPIAKNTHPRMAERAARASNAIRQIAMQRHEQRRHALEAQRRAQELFDASDYEGAAFVIDEVPAALWSDEIRQLQAHVAARQQEIATCVEDLRMMVRERRTAEIPGGIERLLAIKPDHAYAHKLAEQLQEHFVVAAEKHLTAHRYDEALHSLRQIDPRVQSLRAKELRNRVAELSSLTWDLRNSPVFDKTLQAFADRLTQLSPEDPQAIKLQHAVRQRVKTLAGKTPSSAEPWARPPQKSPLNVPVEWLTKWRHIECADPNDLAKLEQHPGRFAVACGLALAGIRQAAVNINLRPTQQPGILSKMKRIMQSDLSTSRSAWGIDLGVSSLKAVKIQWHESKNAVVESVALIDHAKPLSYAANEIEQKGIIADTMRSFLESHHPKSDRICVSLPGRMALARYADLPKVSASKAKKLVEFEAPYQFPIALSQLDWDYQIFDEPPTTNAGETSHGRRAMLVGVQRHAIDRFVEPFRLLGIQIDLLQPDFVALHNYIVHEMFPASPESPMATSNGAVATLDVGADVTNLLVSSPQSLWYHGCGVAGQSFTRALVRHFQMSLTQAEQIKRAPETAERLSDIEETLTPVYEDLLNEVQQSLATYAEVWPNHPIQRIYGLGGGFSLHGLFRYLRCGR